jgi:isopenicillin-N N-acyltransferase-like protein
MSLPLVALSGSPFEQGRQHGEALRERIVHNLGVYFERFEREVKLPRDEVLCRARLYARVVEDQNPAYWEGLRGIAAGSGFDLDELTALNVRYEILYYQYAQKALVEVSDGCTSFAVLPPASAEEHLILGQNWDWIPQVQGAVLHTTEPDGLETLSFTEAGIFGGKIGLNSEGLGLAINGLISTEDDWSRLCKPFHVRCYEILRSKRLQDAVKAVTGSARSCSTNYMIAQAPDRAVDIEAAPEAVRLIEPSEGCLVHSNHFVEPAALDVEEPVTDRRVYSCNRIARLRELLLSRLPVTVEQIQGYLRDHHDYPNALCRHPDPALPEEQRSITVTSVVMDLHARTMEITDRQPCENAYQRFEL